MTRAIVLVCSIICILLVSIPVQSNVLTWSNKIKKGDSYQWLYAIYSGFPRIPHNYQIKEGTVVRITVLQDLSSLQISNSTCDTITCYIEGGNSSTLTQYFRMYVNNTLVDQLSLDEIVFYLYPLYILSTTGVVLNHTLADQHTVTKSNNEYIQTITRNYIDNYMNLTIHWDASTGVMNYYHMQSSTFAGPSEILVERIVKSSDPLSLPVSSVFLIGLVIPVINRRRHKIGT